MPERLPRVWVMVAFAIGTSVLSRVGPLVVRRWAVEPFVVPSPSMVPSLRWGDQFFAVKLGDGARLSRGDLVVFHEPERGVAFVQRVIGLPGDTLRLDGQMLTLNGAAVEHSPCAVEQIDYEEPGPEGTALTAHGTCIQETLPDGPRYTLLRNPERAVEQPPLELTVAPGHLWVLGDSRDNSVDSRAFGEIDDASVIGRGVVIWFSWSPREGFRWQRVGSQLSP